MIRLSVNLTEGASEAEITEYLDTRLRRVFNRAAGEAIIAAASAMAVQSGMSIASLLPMARRFRVGADVRSAITGTGFTSKASFTRKKYQGTKYGYGPDGFKSQAHGERLGENAYIVTTQGYRSGTYSLRFDITVLQHAIHETTWQSQQKAKQKFEQEARRLMNELIDGDELTRLIIGVK